jgi:beta-lysine N6-acetyltransferase
MKGYTAGKNIKDIIEIFGKGTQLQHGKLNDRIYLMKLAHSDLPEIIGHLNELAQQESYSKIFCKVPGWASPVFLANGFIIEASIPDFYNSTGDLFFVSKFLNSDRLLNLETDKLKEFSEILMNTLAKNKRPKLTRQDKLIQLHEGHASEIASLYQKVFASYPFPIFDPEYIVDTMKTHIQYFGIIRNDKLIALASSEIDKTGKNAEMTDFATLPEYRGQNLSVVLLAEMEKIMLEQNITTLYTIARLNSIAMNKTFLKLNYKYAGTLIKNTNISGKIETMNVLYKHLSND